jgi:hypothetical protein
MSEGVRRMESWKDRGDPKEIDDFMEVLKIQIQNIRPLLKRLRDVEAHVKQAHAEEKKAKEIRGLTGADKEETSGMRTPLEAAVGSWSVSGFGHRDMVDTIVKRENF